MAINAGIHILPVSISGGFEHVQVPVCDIDDGQGKADYLRGDLCLGCIKKGGFKGNPLYVNSLFLDELYRKDAIQSTGEK
jgi:hypothetical protein